jgi:hypothetical protein
MIAALIGHSAVWALRGRQGAALANPETELTAVATYRGTRRTHIMRFTFAMVAVFICAVTLGFALNPDNRDELNRGIEMLWKLGDTQLSYIH